MFETSLIGKFIPARTARLAVVLVLAVLAVPLVASAQSWTWTTETVDTKPARFISLASDKEGNLHVSYVTDPDELRYGFRPAGSSKWYTMRVDRGLSNTTLRLDREGNPHICYISYGELKYAWLDGSKWMIHHVAPNSGLISYNCGMGIGPDGTPHLTWYHERLPDSTIYIRMRYATLKDGQWIVRTLDQDPGTGKWSTIQVDEQGRPHIIYTAWDKHQARYASWDGQAWSTTSIGRTGLGTREVPRGMGNSMVLDAKGNPNVSYFDELSLKYARRENGNWVIHAVDTIGDTAWNDFSGFRSSLVLDGDGRPHISYEDAGALKHAYWDGQRWRIQLIANRAASSFRYSSFATDPNGALYLAFQDGVDRSLRVAVGRSAPADSTAAQKQENQ